MQVTYTGSTAIEEIATIANAAFLSGAVDLDDKTLVGIVMPAAWTAANLTFQVSSDGVTYNDLYDNVGIEKNIIAAASRFIIAVPADWVGVRYVKVRSGTAAATVAQAAQRDIKLITKAV